MSRFHYRRQQRATPPALPRNSVLHGDCIAVLASSGLASGQRG
jgi:hypothetical protein